MGAERFGTTSTSTTDKRGSGAGLPWELNVNYLTSLLMSKLGTFIGIYFLQMVHQGSKFMAIFLEPAISLFIMGRKTTLEITSGSHSEKVVFVVPISINTANSKGDKPSR